MAEPKFNNENTWFNANQSPENLEAFHAKYEETLKDVRGRLGRAYPLLIGGKEVQGTGTFDDTNPGNTTEVVAKFQKATKAQVDEAVAAAKAAQPAWEALGWQKRVAIVKKAGDIMSRRKYELAAIMCLENGKNRVEAIYDVDEAIDFLRFYAYTMEKQKGYVLNLGEPFPGETCTSVMRACGVFGVIGPFNFPVAIPCGMTTGAIITGNTTVLKPASDAPWSAYEVCMIYKEAGLPDGVINFITGGGRDVGQPLIDHPDLGGIVFTGSRDVGMTNYAKFVGTRPRPYICEMGGKNAIVVTAKANVDKAVDGVMNSAFGFSGQKCSAASRAYVHESLYDEFITKLVAKTKTLKVGDATAKDTFLGPLINQGAVDTFDGAVKTAKAEGGKVLVGGGRPKDGSLANGHYCEPTIVVDLPDGADAFRTEYFAPFIGITKFSDYDAVLDEVNATDYGLTSGVFTEDEAEVAKYFDRVHSGVVYANRTRGGSTGAMVGGQSFGGWKFSATTSRGAGGPRYLEQFMREQSRTVVKE